MAFPELLDRQLDSIFGVFYLCLKCVVVSAKASYLLTGVRHEFNCLGYWGHSHIFFINSCFNLERQF